MESMLKFFSMNILDWNFSQSVKWLYLIKKLSFIIGKNIHEDIGWIFDKMKNLWPKTIHPCIVQNNEQISNNFYWTQTNIFINVHWKFESNKLISSKEIVITAV